MAALRLTSPRVGIAVAILVAACSSLVQGTAAPIGIANGTKLDVGLFVNGQLVKVTGSGHSLLTTSPCAIDIAAAFLKKPMGQLKSECSD